MAEEHIEELLSNYIDDELTERERNEVKRLIGHDADVRRKFEQLRKIKVLLNLAPVSLPPDNILENVKNQIERQVLLGDYSLHKRPDAGRKHLILRRALTAAAVLVLVAALAWVIMDILIPRSEPAAPVAMNRKVETKREVLYEKPVFADTPVKRTLPFYAKLELTTTKLQTVDAFISKMILSSDMFDMITSVDRRADTTSYSINCSRQDVTALLAQIAPAWAQCQNVQLSIAGETVDSLVTIDNVSIDQTIDVFSIAQPQKRRKIVKEMAHLNQMTQPSQYQKAIAQNTNTTSNLLRPTQPVLTTARRPSTPPKKSKTTDPVNLTIIVH